MSSRYPGRSPAYVRIRVEYCAARGKSGSEVKAYLSRSFSSPDNFEVTLDKLYKAFGSGPMPPRELQTLRRQIREAKRKSRADLPPEVDLDILLKKRKVIAQDAKQRFTDEEMLKVLERVPLRDFQTYRAAIQRHLVRYLAHGNRTSNTQLRKNGLKWSTYKPGNAKSLFGGKNRLKKRASKKR